YSQPGASQNTLATGTNAVLLIEVNGAGAGAGVDGLTLTAGNSTVRGLVINRFTGSGVVLSGASAGADVIAGNCLGTNAAGTADLGNSIFGLFIGSNAHDNTVGGSTAAARNVISGNDNNGIQVSGGAGSGNQIQGNYIGLNAAGTAAVGNTVYGVHALRAGLVIGGTTPGTRNVISGNLDDGMRVAGDNIVIQGN